MTTLSPTRPRRLRPIAFLAASLALVAAAQVGSLIGSRELESPAAEAFDISVAPVPDAGGAVAQIDRSIAVWKSNVARNDRDFLAARNLGLLYETRARLGGDATDYQRAEDAAMRSLAIEPDQLDVQALHARVLLSTHQFAEALAEAAAIDRSAPNQPAILAIMGDATLELGDVEGAAALYDRIEMLTPSAAVTARQARVAFLRDDASAGLELAAAAYAAASGEGQTGASLSWYAFFAGTLTIDAGDPEGAGTWFERALAAWPGSFQALAGQARVAAALGDTDGAIEAYQAANAIAPQPSAFRYLGDLLLLRGDDAGAAQAHERFLSLVRPGGQPNTLFTEELVLFLGDHRRDVSQALDLAKQNLEATQDAHAYDAYAWALLANDRVAEASTAIASALDLSGRDATVLYHAGVIELAAGDADAGRAYLEASLAIRGGLDPLAASRAKAGLDAPGQR
jgi:tetratricopeptide (TPR) repeat protein